MLRSGRLNPRRLRAVGSAISVFAIWICAVVFAPNAEAREGQSRESLVGTTSHFPDELTIRATLYRYLVVNPDGSTNFDMERAVDDNVDPTIIEIGDQANVLAADNNATQAGVRFRDLNPTNYGRWCGKNNSGPGHPIDSLDRACMGHDQCLNIRRPVCDCDREFINRLRQIRHQYSAGPRVYLEAAIVVVPRWHGCNV